MTLPSKAVLLDVRVFLADNNIRRNTSAFDINYGSTSGDVSMNSFSLVPNQSKTIECPDPCAVTVLRTSVPITAQVTVRPSDPANPPTVFTLTVSKLLVLDSNVQSILLTSLSATDTAKVSLQQG